MPGIATMRRVTVAHYHVQVNYDKLGAVAMGLTILQVTAKNDLFDPCVSGSREQQ